MSKIKIFNRVRKARLPKQKIVYSESALQARDKYGLRPRDYLYVLIAGLFSFIVMYWILNIDKLKSFLLAVLIAVIILLILRKLEEEVERKEVMGWLIVWKDRQAFYINVPSFHNMKLVFGRAVEIAKGVYESIPDSFYMTYYIKRKMQRSFNPMLQTDQKMIAELKAKGEKVYFCDGTATHRNALGAFRNLENLKESKGLTGKNIKHTTDWLMGGKKETDG